MGTVPTCATLVDRQMGACRLCDSSCLLQLYCSLQHTVHAYTRAYTAAEMQQHRHRWCMTASFAQAHAATMISPEKCLAGIAACRAGQACARPWEGRDAGAGAGRTGMGELRMIHSRVSWMLGPVDRSISVSAPHMVLH